MKKAFQIQLLPYAPLLKNSGFRFSQDEKTLTVGKPVQGYALSLSCRTLDTLALLALLLPELKVRKLSFRLIKDQACQYKLNSGIYGENEVGKVMVVFIPDLDILLQLTDWLIKITAPFKGPIVPGAYRISEIIYLQQIVEDKGKLTLISPDEKEIPFTVPLAYRQKSKRKKFIGRYYLPVKLLKASPKGDIYKAINLRHFAFKWCLIKEGKPVALDDHFNRDMRHRLRWQREIIKSIDRDVSTPAYIDYLESGETCYLVTNFAEGEHLGAKIRGLLNGTSWLKLTSSQKKQLLVWYAEALRIVSAIHENGIVHRDITDTNFMVSDDGSLCIIDFELAFHMDLQEPNPPFLLGTFGYAAPEQLQYAVPDFSEDIYALGALLIRMLTGIPPYEIIGTDLRLVQIKLLRLTEHKQLTALAIRCLDGNRGRRPSIFALQQEIRSAMNLI